MHVYRLVSTGTVEERIVQRAEKKLYLDQMVNRGSSAKMDDLEQLSGSEMLSMVCICRLYHPRTMAWA